MRVHAPDRPLASPHPWAPFKGSMLVDGLAPTHMRGTSAVGTTVRRLPPRFAHAPQRTPTSPSRVQHTTHAILPRWDTRLGLCILPSSKGSAAPTAPAPATIHHAAPTNDLPKHGKGWSRG